MINPVTLFITLACLREQCLENLSCPGQIGLAGCLVLECGKALPTCVKKTSQEIATEMKKENPSASPEALRRQAEATVLDDLSSVMYCLSKADESLIDTMLCFLDAMLGNSQQQNNSKTSSTFKSSNLGYISCWMKKVTTRFFSCIDHYDLDTLITLEKYFKGSQDMNSCVMEKFSSLDNKCISASMRLYGKKSLTDSETWKEFADCGVMWSNIWSGCMNKSWYPNGVRRSIPTEAKDMWVCIIDEVILATAEC
ncbi:hypothetical protein KOW79_004647 [Hemibagrus wyckioides]|uniref:Uncharacterized protein n=1 Tax=Hemibagrus wyckioides TaxID=337641 RepID=A0A9D3P1B8_9TELE|nr:uncharacterized protein LOC131353222 [Hemibagrus wyckioides]KAG7332813.1 hypothetical protein KOW79_004647 [Hemibagrus wyckioides]